MSVPALRFNEFSGDWEEKTLGDVAEIKRGAPSQHLNYVTESEDGIRLLRINDFLKNEPVYVVDTDNIKKFRVQTNDLLIAGTGATAGIVFRVPNEFSNMSFSYNAPRIRVTKAYYGFIYFYLISDVILRQQRGLFVGNAQPFLDTDAMRSFVINAPSLPEQTKVANFLTAVDEKITLLTQKADLLSQYKKGVMQQIFSQELRFKDDDGQEFLDWEEKVFADILIKNRLGGNYANSEYETNYPLIKMGNLDRGNIKLNKIEYINQDEIINPEDKINYGDLFFNTRNTLDLVGKVAIWRNELPEAYYNSNLMLIKFDNNFFMNYRLNSHNGMESLKAIATGTTSVAAIYTKDLLKIKVEIPSLPEQTKIANFLTAVDEKITTNQTQLNAVKQYKQGLLQQMFV